MNTKKISFWVIALISLSLFIGCAPKFIYKSYWQTTPVIADGKTNDWEVPLRFFDPKTKLNYSVSNDGENLYICIRATDDDNVSGITRRGLQIWIDTTGKKGHQVGILCPVPQKSEHSSDDGEKHKNNSGSDNTEQQTQQYTGISDTARLNRIHRRFLENTKQMHVSGFKNVPDGLLELPNTFGINLGISWNNSNVLVYEAAIPLKSFLKHPLLPSDSSKVLGISFNFSITQKRINNGGGGRGMGGGGGMHGGGGMGGGGGRHEGGEGSSGSSEPEPESIWTAFHLSTKSQ